MSKVYIFDNTPLKLAEGPTLFAGLLSEEEERLEDSRRYFNERALFCCGICGIYLELDERNTPMKCNICLSKPFNAEHPQEAIKN